MSKLKKSMAERERERERSRGVFLEQHCPSGAPSSTLPLGSPHGRLLFSLSSTGEILEGKMCALGKKKKGLLHEFWGSPVLVKGGAGLYFLSRGFL
jgi:hypothetical protein